MYPSCLVYVTLDFNDMHAAVSATVSAEKNNIDITACRVPAHWQLPQHFPKKKKKQQPHIFQDAVTNILESIESGVIPEKEGSAMIKRPFLLGMRGE